MPVPVSRIHAQNFRSLRDVDVPLGPLSVLVGPNGSGKSNLLRVLQFIATAARFDIDGALEMWGGFEHVQRQTDRLGAVVLEIEGKVTTFASDGAPDSYRLRLNRTKAGLTRSENLNFKRVRGPGRRITVSETQVTVDGETRSRLATNRTSGLSALARLSADLYGPGPSAYLHFLTSIRYLDPQVELARQPSRIAQGSLSQDASNLADVLFGLHQSHRERFDALVDDVRRCLPGLEDITFAPVLGSAPQVSVSLQERGIAKAIPMADASFGTVRLLALLAALHDPTPPTLTVIEEVDHGLHPYALDVLVDRMRAASERTQILAATHSPTLVNRLEPGEIVVCDRDPESGESIIPARGTSEIAAALDGSDYRAGELWFAGALGGVPQ